MRHDRDIQPITVIRPRKLPAVALSALLALPLAALMLFRRDALIWLGGPAWIALTTACALVFGYCVLRLLRPEPLMRISPAGIAIPHILRDEIRWADIAKIQATTRRGKTGDIHDRLVIHLKQPHPVAWRSSRMAKLLGDAPQAAIPVSIGLDWPLRADDVRDVVRGAARTYAAAAGTHSDTAPPRPRMNRPLAAAFVMLAAALPLAQHVLDIGLPREFSEGLALYRAGNVAAAIPFLENDARAGDMESAFALGTLYLNGDGVTRNTSMAAGWFQRAARAGNADAAFNLGNAYRLGVGVPANVNAAVQWYETAAGAGSAEAAYALGKMFRLGDGVRRDYDRAVAWLNNAADKGFAPAEHDLGQLYQQGIAVPRDLQTAREWFSRAAKRGHAPARFDLARLLLDGDSAQRTLGLTYLLEAAEQGYAPAQRRLSALYFKSQTVPADPVAAYKWISLAERSWPAASRADLVREKARIAARLTPAELEKAKTLVRAWRPAGRP